MLPNSILCPVFRLQYIPRYPRSRPADAHGVRSLLPCVWILESWNVAGGWGRAPRRTKNLPFQRSPKNNYQLTQVAFERDFSIGMSGLSLVSSGAQRCVEELNKNVCLV